MKKMVFIAGALMVLAAGSALAQNGTNLAWNDCLGGGGLTNRTATCSNTGSGNLFFSFVLDHEITDLVASDYFTDVQAANTVSNWWNPPTFGTRWAHAAGLSPSGFCPGWFDLAPSGPIAFAPTSSVLSTSRIRIRSSIVVAVNEPQDVVAGTEYLSGQLTLKNTAGTFGNVECQQGAAIGVVHMELTPAATGGIQVYESPAVTNCTTFQGATSGKTCPGATPTKKATWGSIKALYR